MAVRGAMRGSRRDIGHYALTVRYSAGMFENPQHNSSQSGIGVLSGWMCAAEAVTIEVVRPNGDVWQEPAAVGMSRTDTASMCGHSATGFGLLWNWNNLGDGQHTVRAFVDGEEFAWSTVTVTTLGKEFRQGLSGVYFLEDFPASGNTVTVEWQGALQNFVITGVGMRGSPHGMHHTSKEGGVKGAG